MENYTIPAWVENALRLTRPAIVSATVAIPSLGAFSLALVCFVGELLGLPGYRTAMHMATVSITFLRGIPEAVYGMITVVAGSHIAAKTVEAIKSNPPVPPPDAPAPPAPTVDPAPAPEPGTPVLQ